MRGDGADLRLDKESATKFTKGLNAGQDMGQTWKDAGAAPC
ncbi:hypothetical protein [Streptomyces sp. NPDC048462]